MNIFEIKKICWVWYMWKTSLFHLLHMEPVNNIFISFAVCQWYMWISLFHRLYIEPVGYILFHLQCAAFANDIFISVGDTSVSSAVFGVCTWLISSTVCGACGQHLFHLLCVAPVNIFICCVWCLCLLFLFHPLCVDNTHLFHLCVVPVTIYISSAVHAILISSM